MVTELFVLDRNTWNHITVQTNELWLVENVTYKLLIHLFIYELK